MHECAFSGKKILKVKDENGVTYHLSKGNGESYK